MRLQKGWRELSNTTRLRIVVLGVVQIVLLGAALWDISQRSPEQIRGSKKWWIPLLFVNYVGPIAYFLLGRQPKATEVLPETSA